jgi:trans-aconitate methyltransferase
MRTQTETNPPNRDDWNSHWQQHHQAAELNPAQRYRRELIFALLGARGSGEGLRILDLGSGQGDMAAAIRSRYPSAEILGLELSESGVDISRRKVPTARFIQRDLLDPVEPTDDTRGWATHAICSEVIEHLDDPCRLLKNARSYMSEDCRLVLTAPGGPMSAFDKHIGHRKHWKAHEIETLLREAGFAPEHVSGVGFPFFNLYRCVVILRGSKLVHDVSSAQTNGTSLLARLTMAGFSCVIRPILNSSRRGWQMIGTARVPNSCRSAASTL